MELTITRRQAIKAARTEPLQGGRFVQNPNLEDIGSCPVCMIGGVLRQHKLTNRQIQDEANGLTGGYNFFRYNAPATREKEIANLLDHGNFLSALSCFFEGLVAKRKGRKPTKKDREKLVEFIKKNFPKSFEVCPHRTDRFFHYEETPRVDP